MWSISNINDQPLLTRQIYNLYLRRRQKDEDLQSKIALKAEIEGILDDTLNSWFEVRFVGSTTNGLATDDSDLDLCLRENSDLSSEQIAKDIYEQLTYYNLATNVYYIKEIPLVHFELAGSDISVELSINTDYSIRNTHLIRCYTRLNWRVKPLIVAIKLWAEQNDINEPSKRGLSSYSLALMAIHYLQHRCRPAVLPCLHKMRPEQFASDSNIDIDELDESLPNFASGQPGSTIGTLFEGFLRYYATEFDFENEAISVRLGGTISKTNSKLFVKPRPTDGRFYKICIEEPFTQTNTAKAVQGEKAFDKIKSAFEYSWHAIAESRNLRSVIL